jgi:hypothetical protein
MDPKHREDGRERDEARRVDEGDAEPDGRLTPPPRPELGRRSRGGTGIGRDLDH